MDNYRFTQQSNQFFGECLPCTAGVFNTMVNDAVVSWKIGTRQAVESAISEGRLTDTYSKSSDFQKYCLKQQNRPRAGAAFAQLSTEDKLLQWVQSLKESLPCFIFAVREFEAVAKTDKEGNPVLDETGQPVLFRRRKQENIIELSGLFMFDADHLPMDPREVFERTQRKGFPWKVRLSHKTSSGHGLRLVSEAITEIGNIADNQIEMARELGLLVIVGATGKPVSDDSCIDASRISYCPRKEDIYFIDEDKLFNL